MGRKKRGAFVLGWRVAKTGLVQAGPPHCCSVLPPSSRASGWISDTWRLVFRMPLHPHPRATEGFQRSCVPHLQQRWCFVMTTFVHSVFSSVHKLLESPGCLLGVTGGPCPHHHNLGEVCSTHEGAVEAQWEAVSEEVVCLQPLALPLDLSDGWALLS